MLTLHRASKPKTGQPHRMGLAIAGGGPLGAIYELGALHALQDSVRGLALHRLDVYVGVSAGAFIAASLANRISTSELCRVFTNRPDAEIGFQPDIFLRPAYREYLHRLGQVPGVLKDNSLDLLRHPLQASVARMLGEFSRAIPTGLFDNAHIQAFLHQLYSQPGRSDRFQDLSADLIVVAADLDNGAAVRFGSGEQEDVPISSAVQASAALPGLYPPVKIGDRYYLDGALRRTLHASAALDQNLDLLIGINPLVPYNSDKELRDALDGEGHLVEGGLPLILSQTFRALIHSRMKVGFDKYRNRYPATDLMLMEPNRDDRVIFFTNIFSYSSRNRLIEHAYQGARTELRKRRRLLNPTLKRFGMSLNTANLNDKTRTLSRSLDERPVSRAEVGRRLGQTLEELDAILARR